MKTDPYKLFLGTLSNPKRLAIIRLLRKGPKNVSQMQKFLGYEQSTISHNLTRLLKCGFVHRKQNGKERIYSLNRQTIEPLLKLIDKHTDKYCKHLCCN